MARIVLIDDDDTLRELLAAILVEAGHEVTEARNGAEGLEAIRKESPGLVVCDIMMPAMDGYAVLQAVRKDSGTEALPFLFLTGNDTPDDVRAGMHLGADDYLTKPVRPAALVAAVDARLQRHKAGLRLADRKFDEMSHGLVALLPHELRSPLTSILGAGRMIREMHRMLSPSEMDELADSVVLGAKRLNRLVENHLLLAEFELARAKASPSQRPSFRGESGEREVREEAEEVAAEEKRGGDMRLELQDVRVPLQGAYLRKIVHEVVRNAFRFSEPGSEVRILLTRSPDGGVALEVADAGRGMTEAEARAIGAFRQFGRASFEQQGAGLGLTVVRQIAEFSGGRFGLVEPHGAGTRVRLEWPLGEA